MVFRSTPPENLREGFRRARTAAAQGATVRQPKPGSVPTSVRRLFRRILNFPSRRRRRRRVLVDAPEGDDPGALLLSGTVGPTLVHPLAARALLGAARTAPQAGAADERSCRLPTAKRMALPCGPGADPLLSGRPSPDGPEQPKPNADRAPDPEPLGLEPGRKAELTRRRALGPGQ